MQWAIVNKSHAISNQYYAQMKKNFDSKIERRVKIVNNVKKRHEFTFVNFFVVDFDDDDESIVNNFKIANNFIFEKFKKFVNFNFEKRKIFEKFVFENDFFFDFSIVNKSRRIDDFTIVNVFNNFFQSFFAQTIFHQNDNFLISRKRRQIFKNIYVEIWKHFKLFAIISNAIYVDKNVKNRINRRIFKKIVDNIVIFENKYDIKKFTCNHDDIELNATFANMNKNEINAIINK